MLYIHIGFIQLKKVLIGCGTGNGSLESENCREIQTENITTITVILPISDGLY